MGCAGYETVLSVRHTEQTLTAEAIPEKYGLTQEEIRNARNAYLGYAACVKRERAARDAMQSPLMQLDPRSCPRIILEYCLDSDRQDLVSSYATQSLGTDEYEKLADILERGGVLEDREPEEGSPETWESQDMALPGSWEGGEKDSRESSGGNGWRDSREASGEATEAVTVRRTAEAAGDPSGQGQSSHWKAAGSDPSAQSGKHGTGSGYRMEEEEEKESASRTLSPALRYAYELITFSGSDAKSTLQVTQGTENPAAEETGTADLYEDWEDTPDAETKPWDGFVIQGGDGTPLSWTAATLPAAQPAVQTKVQARSQTALRIPQRGESGNSTAPEVLVGRRKDKDGEGWDPSAAFHPVPVSWSGSPWIADPYEEEFPSWQEDGIAEQDNPTTSIENRYRARMVVEIRSFSIPLCEEMEQVVRSAIYHHTEDLKVSGDDLTETFVSRKITSSADPTLAQLQKRRTDTWQEAVKEREDCCRERVMLLDRKEQKLFSALCREDPALQEDLEADRNTVNPATVLRSPEESGSPMQDGVLSLPESGIFAAAEKTDLWEPDQEVTDGREADRNKTDLARTVLKGTAQREAARKTPGREQSPLPASGTEACAVRKMQGFSLLPLPQLLWWTRYQLIRKLTPARILWMLVGALAVLLTSLTVIAMEVSLREVFWCAEELSHFTDLPAAGPLSAAAPKGQLRRDLEKTEAQILRLAKEHRVESLYVLLGEEDMEHVGKKDVPSPRELNLLRCLEGRLVKSGIHLTYGNPEKFKKDEAAFAACDAVLCVCRQGVTGGGDLREKTVLSGNHKKQILGILLLCAPPLSGREKRQEKRKIRKERARKRRSDQRRRQRESIPVIQ